VRHPHRRRAGIGHLTDRRAFLRIALAALLAPLAAPARPARSEGTSGSGLSPELKRALETSPFVYVSPLRSDGSESRCHAEVWYGWLDGAAVVITGSERWKARSVRRGLDRARLWVGDFGRSERLLGQSERFRQAPSFEARAAIVRDEALLERLLATFATKYPEEIEHWRGRMREGYADGTRVVVRYTPL
jgi:hypothetical protein